MLAGARSSTRSYWGIVTGAPGIAVCAIGIVLSSQYSAQRDLRMSPGDTVELGGYHFLFDGAKHHEGPNYTPRTRAASTPAATAREIATPASGEAPVHRAESDDDRGRIDAGFYPRPLRGASASRWRTVLWAVRVHVKLPVRWIWFGGLLMAFGGAPWRRSTGATG